ncbi:hypothetical protein CDD80_5463 [Ophiocordyceps camponoti-rufipedis]|uniref:Magnesium transporter protein 1 n=1 Tax=Ophiocordyceps camponoti-rufipedis TaxID=2004952 RepID=A0A2C5XU29_9HYPO|nr:hypothetical protein CDD80_5463 [Ophiocordyceps camponoti-rufipedis]
MRLLKTLVASALALVAAAEITTEEKASMEKRFTSFHDGLKLAAAPIAINDAVFKELTAAPRDFTVAVLLTAQGPRFGCQLCREFQPEWELTARSWAKGDKAGETRMLFATLDFAEGRETFIKLGLQTAPVLLLYPPTHGPHAVSSRDPKRYDFNSGPPAGEKIYAWIVSELPGRPHPPFQRPINFIAWASAVTALAGVATLAYTAGPYILPIIQNRQVWATGTMIAILLFISGHMFNHIRKVPYVGSDGKGGVTYIAPGFQNQYGLETQIIATLYGIMSFCTIALVTRVPRIANRRTQTLTALAIVAVMFVTNSIILRIFRIKNSGYPFSTPPFM